MKLFLSVLLALFITPVFASEPTISIPEKDIALIKTTDSVEVNGTSQHNQPESFTIHDAKAIKQFVGFLTDDRYIAVPKSLKPDFKSPSAYNIRFFSNGQPIFELKVIADSVLDIPNDPSFYMESDRYSDILMAPLRRLR